MTEINYKESIEQIGEILARFKNQTMSVDELAEEVERATKLISNCREKLLKVDEKLQKITSE